MAAPIVTVWIHKQPLKALISTGSTHSCIYSAALDKLEEATADVLEHPRKARVGLGMSLEVKRMMTIDLDVRDEGKTVTKSLQLSVVENKAVKDHDIVLGRDYFFLFGHYRDFVKLTFKGGECVNLPYINGQGVSGGFCLVD